MKLHRVFWLDAARAIAIVLVVFTHAHEQAGIQSDLLKSIFYSVDRLGVPIFFMISGGLILPKLVGCDLFSFYKKRIPQFIVLLVFWSVLTNCVRYYAEGGEFLASFQKALINNNGIYPANYGGAHQMWFMYSIIQLYLIAPFLARLLHQASNKEILVFVFLCALFNQTKRTGEYFGGDWGFLHKLGADLTGPYLIYFVLGYLILNRSLWCGDGLKHLVLYVVLTLVPIASLVFIDLSAGKVVGGGLHWYGNSLFIVLSGVGLLLTFRWLFLGGHSVVLSLLARFSFGIYLSHYLFIYVSKAFWYEGSDLKLLFLYFLFSILSGIALTFFMMQLKPTRYFVE